MQKRLNFQRLGYMLSVTEVRVLIALLVLANATLLIMGVNGLPTTLIEDNSGLGHVLFFLPLAVINLIEIGLVYFITRNRPLADWKARTPERGTALRETIFLWIYAVIALVVLGAGFDIGLHIPGTIFEPGFENSSTSILTWAGVNFVVFAVIPYLVFRRLGYSNEQLSLKSHNWRADAILIVSIIVVESLIELFGVPDGMRFFQLSGGQIAIGGLLTMVIHLFGTGIPIMIFVQSILVPRYYRMTGSLVSAVVVGGFTYATFHIFEFWTVYQSAETTIVSILFVYLQFAGPGMIKAIMTLRSGNAWTHLWGYHMVAPHLLTDTNLIVNAFDIR